MDAERPNMETIERFPADIDAAARAVVERGYDEGLLISVKRALLAERERCAKIAEEDCRTALAIEHGYQPTWYVRARAIAAAIRNP